MRMCCCCLTLGIIIALSLILTIALVGIAPQTPGLIKGETLTWDLVHQTTQCHTQQHQRPERCCRTIQYRSQHRILSQPQVRQHIVLPLTVFGDGG